MPTSSRRTVILACQDHGVRHCSRSNRTVGRHDLGPRRRPRFARTTDSDHEGPIFPFIYELHGPDQLWVADLTYIALATGFVYLAVVLDARSRRVVGYALGRRIDARLTVAALARAIASRRPLPGCVFHSGGRSMLRRSTARFSPRTAWSDR